MPKRPPAPTAKPASSPSASASTPGSAGTEIVELSRFRADLSRGKRQRRADTLLASSDPRAAVRALPPDEFYYALHEVGFPDAGEILQYGSTEQVQTALDFALWDRDKLDLSTASMWLEAMVEAPITVLGAWAQGIDVELFALLLRGRTRIHDISLEEEPDDSAHAVWPTPDRLFLIELLGDETEQHITQEMLEKLYRYDRQWMRKVLVGTRSELDSELEEHAYRWRSGRMADLGFEDYYAALEVYREIDPATVKLGDSPNARVRPLADEQAFHLGIPAALAERLAAGSPFARAVAGVNDKEELTNLEAALRMLSNRVLAADRVTPGDDEAVTAALERMAGTLDMAVEFLARGSLEDGVRAVRTVPLVRLFQLGVSLVGRIRRLATTLRKQNPYSHLRPQLDVFEREDAELLAACTRLRPLYPRWLDVPPAAGERAFASLADLRKVSAALETAAAAVTFLHGLGLRAEHLAGPTAAGLGDPAAIDAGSLARTMLARTLLQQPAEGVVPLDAGLAAQLKHHLKNAQQNPAEYQRATETLQQALAARWPSQPLSAGALAVTNRWVTGLLRGEPVLVNLGG